MLSQKLQNALMAHRSMSLKRHQGGSTSEAIAAGIMLLVEETAVTVDTIEQVLIAGAFGNYMSPESACQLSMIPPTLRNRIIPIGNGR